MLKIRKLPKKKLFCGFWDYDTIYYRSLTSYLWRLMEVYNLHTFICFILKNQLINEVDKMSKLGTVCSQFRHASRTNNAEEK
jgi:hypothetical protein